MISLWKGLSHPDTGGGWGTWGRGAAVTLVVLGNGRTQRSQRCGATPRMHSFPGRLYLVLNGIFPAGGPSLAGLRPLRNAVIKHPLWWMFPEHSSPPTPCSPGDGKPMDVHQFLSEEKQFIPGDTRSPPFSALVSAELFSNHTHFRKFRNEQHGLQRAHGLQHCPACSGQE